MCEKMILFASKMIMDELNKPLEKLAQGFIKKKIKAVTFDVDGVIVPTERSVSAFSCGTQKWFEQGSVIATIILSCFLSPRGLLLNYIYYVSP